ncbi:hypothetical protein ACFQJD_09840 [Haloplanus sp. GCM10025708]|uniref:hypothetical protein n=1 Tax=Haloferacaceae TaxID=1644056 RepID=UPI0036111678
MSNTEGRRCPLCTTSFAERRDLQVHLMVEHRKSAVTEELVRSMERANTPLRAR